MSVRPSTAYKVMTAEQMARWREDGRLAGASIDLTDGYIHLSTAEQLAGTLDKHFAGQVGLVVAAIDLALLGDKVRWELSRDGALFPHVYGELPLAAMTAYGCALRDASSAVLLPDHSS